MIDTGKWVLIDIIIDNNTQGPGWRIGSAAHLLLCANSFCPFDTTHVVLNANNKRNVPLNQEIQDIQHALLVNSLIILWRKTAHYFLISQDVNTR